MLPLRMQMRVRLSTIVCLLVLVDGSAKTLGQTVTPATVSYEAFEQDLRTICAFGNRFPGQPGLEQASAYLDQALSDAGITQRWRQPFELVVPVTHHCTLRIGSDAPADIYPVWPNGANLSTTPRGGLTGRAIYIGDGALDALPVDALPGNIAVMEFNSAHRWQYAAMYGASAIVFLPPEDTSWAEANAKYLYISVPLPRFYVSDPALVARLRQRDRPNITIDARVTWDRHTAHNLLGFIPGSHPEHRKCVVVLHARSDATCVVPDLATGAEQAINAAALLQLARRFAADPPAYSVLLCFVEGDGYMLSGSRRLMTTLSHTQRLIEENVSGDVSEIDSLVQARRQLESPNLRDTLSGWEQRPLRHEHLNWQAKRRIGQLLSAITDLRDRTRSEEIDAETRSELEQRIERLDDRRLDLLTLQRRLAHDNLTEDDIVVMTDTFNNKPSLHDRTLTRLDRMVSDRRQRLERRRVDLEIMRGAGLGEGSTGDYKQGLLFISLELSSHGTQFGPFAQSYFCVRNLQNQLLRYGEQLKGYAETVSLPADVKSTYLDDTAEGRRHWQSDLPFPVANGIDAAINAGCLGIMFATTQDMRRWVDTPLDTLDRIRIENVVPQVRMLEALLDRALREPMEIAGSRMARTPRLWKGMAVLASPGEAQSNLGLPDCVLVARGYDEGRGFGQKGIGVRDQFVLKTDGEGRYEVDDIIDFENRPYPIMAEVYRLSDDGRVTMSMDQFGLGIKPTHGHPRMEYPEYEQARGVMFSCTQIGLFGLYDPRYLENLDRVKLIEAARGSEADKRSFVADGGMMSLCIPNDVDRWQLVFAKGDAQRRMVLLNNDAADPTGCGFTRDWVQTQPLVSTSAHDFAVLNEDRLTRLENTGAVNPYLREQHEVGKAEVAEALAQQKQGRADLAWKHAAAGLANQSRVYHKTRSAADDTIHAVLFLLIGLVPFCYFVERLVFGSTDVYRQIGGFAGLFAGMTLLVALFHPAFRISITPLTILLAFLILFLSTLVIVIVIGKFRAELQRLAGDTETGQAGDFKRSSMLHRAMLLGVANMRRRKMRTGLTLATLVLLSFVIMSFTNPSTALHPIHYPITEAPRNGMTDDARNAVMVHRLSWQPMPAWVLDHVRTAMADRADVSGHWWITSNDLRTLDARTFRLEGRDGATAPISAAMCISPVEAKSVGLDTLLTPQGFQRFSSERDGVIVSRTLAKRLQIDPGASLRLFGESFRVSAIVDDKAMLELDGFNGKSYAPIDFMSFSRDRNDRQKLQKLIELAEAAETSGDMSASVQSSDDRPLQPDRFIIMRSERAGEFDATLRSVVLHPHEPSQTLAIADELASQVHRPVYARTGDTVTLCTVAEVTSLAGLGNILVPLIISALIIFNTMLNSVYERREEISIFMSLGLAPAHVGALFMAEAAACGTIGVVGGYILGQALGTLASMYDLIPGLQLNFSSSSAVMTQLAILGVVLLSSLWPARLARQLAAPGSESTWALPEPEGDVLRAKLPFTMLAHDAGPVLAYLRQWLESHTEASLGRFCSGQAVPFARRERDARGLETTIWLAPFDMGLMQAMTLTIQAGEDPLIHEVTVELTRHAGPRSAWMRSNRHFLTELRKQLLLWRSLKSERAERYRHEADMLFSMAPA